MIIRALAVLRGHHRPQHDAARVHGGGSGPDRYGRNLAIDRARVGRHSIIAAGTVLAEGQQVPEGVLVAGVPG